MCRNGSQKPVLRSYAELVAESRALMHEAKAEAIRERECVSTLEKKQRDLGSALEAATEQKTATRMARQAARDMQYRVEAESRCQAARRQEIRRKRLEDYQNELKDIHEERRRREADSERWWTDQMLGVLEEQVDTSCQDMRRVRSEISRTRDMLTREAKEMDSRRGGLMSRLNPTPPFTPPRDQRSTPKWPVTPVHTHYHTHVKHAVPAGPVVAPVVLPRTTSSTPTRVQTQSGPQPVHVPSYHQQPNFGQSSMHVPHTAVEHNAAGNFATAGSPPRVSTTYTTSHTYPGVGAAPHSSGFAQNLTSVPMVPGAAVYNAGIPTGVNQLGGSHATAVAPIGSAGLGSFPPSPPVRRRRPSTARRHASNQPGAAPRRSFVPPKSLTPELLAEESGTESDADNSDDDSESLPDSDDEELVRSINTASRRRRMKRGGTTAAAKRRGKSSSRRAMSPRSRDETDDEETASQLEEELTERRDVLRRERERLAAFDEEAERKNRSHCSHLMRAITCANTEIKGLRTDQHRVLAKERARSRKLERQLTKLQQCYRRVQAAKPRHSWTPSGYGTC